MINKYIILLLLINPFFEISSLNNNPINKDQYLDPEYYFLLFYEDRPFDDVYIVYNRDEAETIERAKLNEGDYCLGSATSSITFKFSVNNNGTITGTYFDKEYLLEYEEYEDEPKYHRQLKIVNSKVISEIITSSNSKYITTYNHENQNALEKTYNIQGKLLNTYEYVYIEDEYENYLDVVRYKEYNLENNTYSIFDYKDNTKSNFSQNDKLLTVEHLLDDYTDIYNEEGIITEKKLKFKTYNFDDSLIFTYPFAFRIVKTERDNKEVFKLQPNITYSVVKEDKSIAISLKTDENALIQNTIDFFKANEKHSIQVENSQPRFFEYKNKNGVLLVEGKFNKKDSSFVITKYINNDSLNKITNKFYFIKSKEKKNILTRYFTKGGYEVANEIDNTLKKYNANNIIYFSESLTGENKSSQTYNDKDKKITSTYVKDGTRYNDIYEKDILTKRSYTNVYGDNTEYFNQNGLYKTERIHFNNDGILYLKEYNAKGEVVKNIEKLTPDNKKIKITERDVLKKIMDLNPNNTLNWDLTEPNLNRLDGITIYSKSSDEKSGRIWKLIIPNKHIQILPKEIKHLKYLNFLSLTKNTLKILPKEVGELKALETLYLENNALTSLPNSLKNLEDLYRVSLSNNKFTEIPEVLFELKDNRFYSLDLEHNLISTVPSSIKKTQTFTEINLSNNKFEKFPKALFGLSNLSFLNMDNNKLTNIPKSIKKLQSLNTLHLGANKITNFPKEISTLKNLKYLDLGNNNIKVIPKEITALENLTYIDLSSNKIEYLPEDIHKLKELKALYIDGNNLKHIPEGISKLSNLNYLDITYNKITTLPNSLASLEKLRALKFHGNPILYISTAICNMDYSDYMEDYSIDEETTTCTDDASLYENYDAAIKTEILKLFNAYKPTIEKAEQAEISSVKIIVGDLDEDDIPDGLLYFTLNNNEPPQVAIYTYDYDGISVVGGFEPDFNFDITKIENNIVYLSKEGKTEKYVLDGRELVNQSEFISE